MFDVFGLVKGYIKLDSLCIDNHVFRLHYKATFVVLLASSLLVTSKQYIGDPIDCIVEEVPNHVMDTYCWIHSTFSVPSLTTGVEGLDVAHPGVAPVSELADGEEIRYHKYYQWVCFTLFFQAILFYIPRYFWKTWEAGKIKLLVQDMNVPIVDSETKDKRINLLVSYFKESRSQHTFYALRFIACEGMNLVNVIGQIFFMDLFLGGDFTRYGTDVLAQTERDSASRNDAMSRVFPKMTKCTFNKFGPSGTVENFDGLCVLPLNIINEKIYVFLWFWFILVAVISGCHMIFRFFTWFDGVQIMLLKGQARLVKGEKIETICKELKYGDWFILFQLSKNIDPLIFKQFMDDLYDKLSGVESNGKVIKEDIEEQERLIEA